MGGFNLEDQSDKYNFPSSKTNFYLCCNPMKIAKHRVTKSLRKITQKIQDLYPHLNSNELICTACRKSIDKMPARKENTPHSSNGRFLFVH